MDELLKLQVDVELTPDDPTWILTTWKNSKFLHPLLRLQSSGSLR
jgi:hypothetical protein